MCIRDRDYLVRGGSQGDQEGRTPQTSFSQKAESRTGRTLRPQDRPAREASGNTAGGKGL